MLELKGKAWGLLCQVACPQTVKAVTHLLNHATAQNQSHSNVLAVYFWDFSLSSFCNSDFLFCKTLCGAVKNLKSINKDSVFIFLFFVFSYAVLAGLKLLYNTGLSWISYPIASTSQVLVLRVCTWQAISFLFLFLNRKEFCLSLLFFLVFHLPLLVLFSPSSSFSSFVIRC